MKAVESRRKDGGKHLRFAPDVNDKPVKRPTVTETGRKDGGRHLRFD